MSVSSLSTSLSMMMIATAPASSATIVLDRNEQSLKRRSIHTNIMPWLHVQ